MRTNPIQQFFDNFSKKIYTNTQYKFLETGYNNVSLNNIRFIFNDFMRYIIF